MTDTAPIVYSWDGENMVPLKRFNATCNKQFVVGQLYRLSELEERSAATHRHFFAALHEAWVNLPEQISVEYPDDESLRKRALIETNHCDVRSFVCASRAEAIRLAAFLRPSDPHAKVEVSGATVIEKTAHSQSTRAMGKELFQKSKSDVLDYVASLIGVTTENLMKESSNSPSISPEPARTRERV